MDGEDPITQFFPGEDCVDLYAVLSLKSDAKLEDIKRSYRRHALIYHPDKHTSSSDVAKTDASTKFQQIGFAYAVLSDEKRKARYDRTGRTDEGFEMAGEDGWEAYFEDLFERVTRGKLDEMKKEYQGQYHDHLPSSEAYVNVIVGSAEEVEDIKSAYMETAGSIGEIMTYIPHSTHDDEARFIILITDLIAKGELVSLPEWESSKKDETSRLVRQKQGKKEAKEAEELAKELGVWDEFYGTGKTGARKNKGKGKKDESADAEEEDHSALQALILKKKKNMDGFFDNLASKYAEPELKVKGKGKKRGGEAEPEEGESSQKKSKRGQAPPEIDDEEFEKLQQKLFGDKAKSSVAPAPKGKAGRGRKAK
jgi:DnaJ homolog subfamily C member 9